MRMSLVRSGVVRGVMVVRVSVSAVAEPVLDQRVDLRLQPVYHLEQLVCLGPLPLSPPLSVLPFPSQCHAVDMPRRLPAPEGLLETPPLGVLGLKSALKVAMDGVELQEAAGLVLDEANVLLHLLGLL